MRQGGSGSVPSQMLGEFGHHALSVVASARSLDPPVYLDTHMRRRSDHTVHAAGHALQDLVAGGGYSG